MDIIAGLVMGCIIGMLWSPLFYQWWDGISNKQDAREQISDDIKALGEEIKATGIEDRRTLETLMKYLNYYKQGKK